MSEKMKKLDVIMVTSTAYSFAPQQAINEVFIKPPITPEVLLKLIYGTDKDTLNRITSKYYNLFRY